MYARLRQADTFLVTRVHDDPQQARRSTRACSTSIADPPLHHGLDVLLSNTHHPT